MMENKVMKGYLVLCILLSMCLIGLYCSLYMSYQQAISSLLVYAKQGSSVILKTSSFHFSILSYFMFFCIWMLLVLYFFYLLKEKRYHKEYLTEFLERIEKDDFHPVYKEDMYSIYENKIFEYKQKYQFVLEDIKKEKRMLNDYIINLAHQIKTPVMAIEINEELASLENDLVYLDNSKKSFTRLYDLFESLFNLPRIENKENLILEKGTLKELFNYIEVIAEDYLKKIDYILEIEDVEFYYEQRWLGESIFNIIKNCCEEDIHKLHIYNYHNNDMLHIVIHDDGPGFHEDDLPYIFDKFYHSKHKASNGIGIGLALCKEVAQKHHGYIEAYNDDGAVFEIVLPLLKGKEKVKI